MYITVYTLTYKCYIVYIYVLVRNACLVSPPNVYIDIPWYKFTWRGSLWKPREVTLAKKKTPTRKIISFSGESPSISCWSNKKDGREEPTTGNFRSKKGGGGGIRIGTVRVCVREEKIRRKNSIKLFNSL